MCKRECSCEWCRTGRLMAAGFTQHEAHALVALSTRIEAGIYAQDRISAWALPVARRLAFLRWLMQQGKVSEALPPQPSRFEQLIAELMTRPVVSIADLQAEERMRRMIPASDEDKE